MTAHCISHKNINEGLENFIREKEIDLLAILSHRRNWFDEIFKKNRAKELSYQQTIPLLVYQTENLK